MAIAVTANISVEGSTPLTDYTSIAIRQELFSHHSFEITVPYEVLEGKKTDGFFHQAHRQYFNKPVAIELTPRYTDDPPLRFKGIITRITLANSADFNGHFVLSGYGSSYLLEDGTQRRTFQKLGLRAIFAQVLQDYPVNIIKFDKPQPQHTEPLKYVVQYAENNYAFLRRLASTYGEWFYYDGLVLRLGRPADEAPLKYTVSRVEEFTMALEVKPARFQLSRYDYLAHQHHAASSASERLTSANEFAAHTLEQSESLFTNPARLVADGHVRSQGQLRTTVREWKSGRVSELVTFQGNGENPAFGVGKVIEVEGESGGETHSYGRYRLSEINHWVQADMYHNTFTALPASAEQPGPDTAAAPPMGVPELAEVIDVADPQRLGRVQVRFHWDVARPQDAESGWLRVSTPYSGDGKGHLFTPEVGSQVLIGYERSLTDFPVVLGNLFHPRNQQGASYSPPQNNLKGIQTAGGNKVVMSEVAGAQTILLSNSNKKGTSILVSFAENGSVSITTNGPITLTAGESISLEAKKNISLRAGGDISLSAKKNVLVEAQEEDIALRAQKEVLISAVSENLTLEAGAKKVVVKAADNVEIEAVQLAVMKGKDVKLSKK